MTNIKTLGVLLLLTAKAHASTIAIVDSGNDFKHKDLQSKAWINPVEIEGNDRDEDKNGFPDDINGWNFAEGNNQLIDYSYQTSDTADGRRFFDIQLKSFLGTITQEDRDWAREKFKDEAFIKNLQIFGNWMHGTHVTGIAVKNSPDAKAVGMKLIPTEVKLPGKKTVESFLAAESDKGLKDTLVKAAVGALASQSSKQYVDIGNYIKDVKADVMNGSFGTSYEAISGVIGKLYKGIFRKDPTPEELKSYADHFFAVNLEETKKFLSASPNTLFVFAAGNEGSNNDVVPSSPTNVDAENKISVAASLGDQALASFSCYGEKNVDVAAPGVGILSASPMDKYLAVSGTSQAAPYVANIATIVKDLNPKLGFREIKKIILETVDVKSWLKGKVKTSGLVNRERALRAASLSVGMSLDLAIAQSKKEVLAKTENEALAGRRYHQVPKQFILPLPSTIYFK
jgi:subtilisin family serine protease